MENISEAHMLYEIATNWDCPHLATCCDNAFGKLLTEKNVLKYFEELDPASEHNLHMKCLDVITYPISRKIYILNNALAMIAQLLIVNANLYLKSKIKLTLCESN